MLSGIPFSRDAVALVPWLVSQSPPVKREIHTAFEIRRILTRTPVIYADSIEARRFLKDEHADAVLLSSGKYLVSAGTAKNDIRLLRILINLETKAFMQVLNRYDRYRYNGIKDLIFSSNIFNIYNDLFPPDRKPDLSPELLINDIVAKIFEFKTLQAVNPDLFLKDQITSQEKEFIKTVEKTGILNNRHNYFTADFWDAGIRGVEIKDALDDNFRFQLVVYTNHKNIMPLIVSEQKRNADRDVVLPVAPQVTNIKHGTTEGTPAAALLTIYQHFKFGKFTKKQLYPLRKKRRREKASLKQAQKKNTILYSPSIVKKEVMMLKKLGILLMPKKGIYRLNPVLEGETEGQTLANIKTICEIELKIGKTNKPLQRGEIPLDRIDEVARLVKYELDCMEKALNEKGIYIIRTREKIIDERIKEWFITGKGLEEWYSWVTKIDLEKIKKTHNRRGKNLLDFIFGESEESDREKQTDVVFFAEKDLNHGFVLNCYKKRDYDLVKKDNPVATFKYFPSEGKVIKIDLAAFDIIHAGYNFTGQTEKIYSLARPFRKKIDVKGNILVGIPKIAGYPYVEFVISLGKKLKHLAGEQAVIVVEKDENHGQVINVYLAEEYDKGKRDEPIKTYKYFTEECVRKVHKKAISINLALLDLVKAYKGDILKRFGRAVGLPIYKDKKEGYFYCEIGFLSDKGYCTRKKLSVSEKYIDKNVNDKSVILKVDKDINQGQVINVHLKMRSKDAVFLKPLSYKYYPDETRHRDGHITKGAYHHVPELGMPDMRDYYGGREDLSVISGRRAELPVKYDSSSGQYSINFRRIFGKNQNDIILTPEQVKIIRSGKGPLKIYAALDTDKDYGNYIKIYCKNDIVLYRWYYFKKIRQCISADFSRMSLLDYMLGNKNIDEESIAPRIYCHNKGNVSKDGRLKLTYRGRELRLARLTPLAGKKIVFVPVSDQKYGYKIHVHDAEQYALNPKRPPEIVMVRNSYFKTLVPLDKVEIFQVREFLEKGLYFQAKDTLEKFLKTHPSDIEGKDLRKKIEERQEIDFFNFYLSLISNSVIQAQKKRKEESIRYFKRIIKRSRQGRIGLHSKLENLLDFDNEDLSQVHINMAVLSVLTEFPDEFKIRELSIKASRLLCYEGEHREELRLAGRHFFESIPDNLMFDYSRVVKVDIDEFWKEHSSDDDFDEKLLYKNINEKPLLTPLGEIKLGFLIQLKGIESAEKEKKIFGETNLRLVAYIVKKYFSWSNLPFSDLFSAGSIGLGRAVEKFEPWRGLKFSTNATWWIKRDIRRHIKAHRQDIRVAVNMQNDIRRFKKACEKADIDPYAGLSDSYIAERIDYSPRYKTKDKIEEVSDVRAAMFEIVSLQDYVGGKEGDYHIEDTLKSKTDIYTAPEQHLMQEKAREIIIKIREETIKELIKRFFNEKGLNRAIDLLDEVIIPKRTGLKVISLGVWEEKHGLRKKSVSYIKKQVMDIFEKVSKNQKFDEEDDVRERVVGGLTKKYLDQARIQRCITILDDRIMGEEDPSLEELGQKCGVCRERIRQEEALVIKILKRVTERQNINIKDYIIGGCPAEALRTIYKNYGFKKFSKNKMIDKRMLLYILRKPYPESTVDTEVSMLKKLGVLFMPKKGIYRLNPVLKGETSEQTERNIAAIYNIRFKTGRKEIPLDRFEIPEEKIPAVKEMVCMEMSRMQYKRAVKTDIHKEPCVIRIWRGYAGKSQEDMLRHIREESKDGPYKVEFRELDKLVNSAHKNRDNKNVVTILPFERLTRVRKKRLQDSCVQFINMDFEQQELDTYAIVQLEAIVAAGAAYLNNDNTAFNNLYKILTDGNMDIGVTIEKLKANPALVIKHIFKLKPGIVEIDDLKPLNDRMKELLSAA